MWSVKRGEFKCGVSSVECKVWSARCGECKVWRVETRRVFKAECEVYSAKCGVQSAKCRVRCGAVGWRVESG